MKRLVIFLSIIPFSLFLNGQIENDLSFINVVKTQIYKKIIFSTELKNNKKCHIITIPSTYLSQKEVPNHFQAEIEEKKDTISLELLRKELPDNYWVYGIDSSLIYINYGEDYIDYFDKQDSFYTPNYLQNLKCNSSFDIIKIYKPFDKWAKLYNSPYGKVKEVIPVKYESLSYGHMSLEKEKYLLYKIELYEESTKVKSVKVVELE